MKTSTKKTKLTTHGDTNMSKKDKWQEWADMEIPTRKELGMHRGKSMSMWDKITLVLTLVNVAILISLVINNL